MRWGQGVTALLEQSPAGTLEVWGGSETPPQCVRWARGSKTEQSHPGKEARPRWKSILRRQMREGKVRLRKLGEPASRTGLEGFGGEELIPLVAPMLSAHWGGKTAFERTGRNDQNHLVSPFSGFEYVTNKLPIWLGVYSSPLRGGSLKEWSLKTSGILVVNIYSN